MMEVTPHLKSVLKNYQHSATKSLQGPGLSLVPPKNEPSSPEIKEEEYLPAAPFPVQQLPILTTPDTSCSERTETILEGETISCFVVGGEKRLCLPQVLNSVLRDFSWQQINQECDQLQIYCSRCTPEQLNLLKNGGILPSGAASSGLITKTDAERLCSALMHAGQPLRPRKPPGAAPAAGPAATTNGRALGNAASFSFAVHHKCFGRCYGVCYPELYTDKNGKCIECRDCQGAFSPQQFVCHVHREFSENRTVHWGFDSANWRAYIKVPESQSDKEQCYKYLDDIKEQYDGKMPFALPPNIYAGIKRKQVLASEIIKDHDLPLKKQKLLAEYLSPSVPYNLYGVYFQQYMQDVAKCHLSAFKPVTHHHHHNKEAKIYNLMQLTAPPQPPPQSQARYSVSDPPPVLQNPERVVPISESERFERSYQPNVALAPPTPKKHRYGRTAYIKQEVKEIKKEDDDDIVVIKQEPAEVEQLPSSAAGVSVVVQSVTSSSSRYNPEIELSTDTEDSASETAATTTLDRKNFRQQEEATRLEEVLRELRDSALRERIREAFRHLVEENERCARENRRKDEEIKELQRRLEARAAAAKAGICENGDENVCSSSSTTTSNNNNNININNNERDVDGGDGVGKENGVVVDDGGDESSSSIVSPDGHQQTSVIASAVVAEPKAIISTAPE